MRKRVQFLVLLKTTLLLISGCTPASQPEHKSATGAAGTVAESRKLGVVSTSFLKMMQDSAKQTSHDSTITIAEDGNGVAYVEPVGSKFRVIHNGVPGNPFYVIGDLAVSNDGKRVAYVAHISDTLRRVVDGGHEGPIYNEIGTPVFTPDGKHLVYTISQDKKNYLVIDHKVHDKYQVVQDVLVSPDSRYLAFVAIGKDNGKKQFVIDDIALQDKKVFDSCGESFLASDDRSRIALTCSEGGERSIKIVDFQTRSVVSTIQLPAAGNLYHLRFGPDNRSFAGGIITEDPRRFVFYNGRIVRTPAGEELLSDPLVFTEPDRVGVILGTATKARFYTDKAASNEPAYGYISEFTASKNGRHHAYVAIKAGGEERMRVVVDGSEGPLFDKVVSPVFSPDGRFLVYRAKQSGKRFMVVSDLKGSIVRQHREYDMVFQPTFTDDGGSVAYFVLDGNEVWRKVEKL